MDIRRMQRDARQLFRLCFVNGRLDGNRAADVVERVIEARRRGYLTLLAEFQRLVRLESDRHRAEIRTVVPLDTEVCDGIRSGLERLYGPVEVQFVHDPALIAGLRISVGSDVYDGSIRYQLAELKKKFEIAM